jgi:transporter family-2 protein
VSNPWILAGFALVAGGLIPVQASANLLLVHSLQSVVRAALVLLATAFMTLTLIAAAARVSPPGVAHLAAVPAHGFWGGPIVATYVLAIMLLAPAMGVGSAVRWIVTGQVLAALLIDHWGLFGASQQVMDGRRLLGAVCMILGVGLART